jgi:hypothetical protein
MAMSVKGLLIFGLTLALAACQPPPGTALGDLLAPCPANAAPSDTAQLHACVDGLRFDSVEAAGDEQRLLVRDTSLAAGPACHGDPTHSCRYGPLAKIEPVIKAHRRSTSQLNEGRIIARLYLQPGETDSYTKLNLEPNDTTYWWIQRTSATTAISKYVRVNGDSAVASPEQMISIEGHPAGTYGQALTRFIWDDADEKTQGPCGLGCCR